jgi:hypothetical protein
MGLGRSGSNNINHQKPSSLTTTKEGNKTHFGFYLKPQPKTRDNIQEKTSEVHRYAGHVRQVGQQS